MSPVNPSSWDSSDGTSQPGSVAEELRSLLDVVAARAEPWLHEVGSIRHGEQHNPATCNWCPLCAALAVIRGERPELAIRAAEHAAGLLAVVRAALAQEQPADAPGAEPEHPSERSPVGAEEPPARRSRVQRIDLRRRGKADGD
ncbi:MAG: hypothetical protein ACRDQ5_13590 [Sciscionella sp.]